MLDIGATCSRGKSKFLVELSRFVMALNYIVIVSKVQVLTEACVQN